MSPRGTQVMASPSPMPTIQTRVAVIGSPSPRGIVTPEAVVLEFETAGVGSRGVAKLIDLGCMQINHHYHGGAARGARSATRW